MPLEPWKTKKSDVVLKNRWAEVRRDDCELPNGTFVDDYYYWEGSDFAQVFAVSASHQVLLVRQYKHAVREVTLELPAGLINPGESAMDCARRELLEETGYTAPDWRVLGTLNVSSAKATTQAHAFLALDIQQYGAQRLDSTEEIEIVSVSISELFRYIENGTLRDSNSLAATLLALRHLGVLETRPSRV